MDWLEIISKVGILGSFCIALAWYIKLQTTNYREDVKQMREEYASELREIRQ